MKYNFDTTRRGVQASTMEVPEWAGRAEEVLPGSSGTIADTVSSSGEDTLRVRGVNTKQDSSSYNPSGLMSSEMKGEPITTDPSRHSAWAQDGIPIEEPDMTEWMVPATTQTVMVQAMKNEYGRAGGMMSVNADGIQKPGVSSKTASFIGEKASDIDSAGEAHLVFKDGSKATVTAPGAEPIITEDSLNYASVSNLQEDIAVGTIYSVQELANNPSEPIRFPTISGNTGPLFVGHEPSRPSVLNRGSVTLHSNEAQVVNFKLRSSRDYTRVIRSFSQEVPKGKSTTTFRAIALGVEPMVAEINPEDGSQAVLTDYSVFP
jgi:hypothetical protein